MEWNNFTILKFYMLVQRYAIYYKNLHRNWSLAFITAQIIVVIEEHLPDKILKGITSYCNGWIINFMVVEIRYR